MAKWFTLVIFLLPLILSGQTVSVSEDISIRNDKAYDIIGKYKDRILLYREKSNKIEIQSFDEKLHLSWNKELDFKAKRPDIIGVIPGKENFSLIYRYKKKGIIYLRANKYDPGANLMDTTLVTSFPLKFNTPNSELVYSEDKTKVLIYGIQSNKRVEAFSFDLETMKLLWTTAFSPTEVAFHEEYREILVTNEGDMYFIESRKNRKSKKEEHYYQVITCNQYNQKLETFSVHMQDHLTFEVYFDFDNLNKRLLAGGLYSDKNPSKANGFFYLNIPANNPENYLIEFHKFDDNFVSNLLGKDIDDNKGIPDVAVQEFVIRRDGGILLICERVKEFERRRATASRGYVRDGIQFLVDYYYDDLIVMSIHPDGNLHWETILHKRQYSQDDRAIFSSYFLVKTPSNLRLLFNDEIRFENTVSEYVLNGNGEYDRNSVMSTDDQNIRLRFRDGVQIGSGSVIVPSERRNRLQLVRITY